MNLAAKDCGKVLRHACYIVVATVTHTAHRATYFHPVLASIPSSVTANRSHDIHLKHPYYIWRALFSSRVSNLSPLRAHPTNTISSCYSAHEHSALHSISPSLTSSTTSQNTS